jgi:hypothetical protein
MKSTAKIITKLMTFITISLLICNVASAQKKYVLKCDSNLLELSHKIALQQVGIQEKTNRNDGEVVKYLVIFGLKEGAPYCAAGQYYCFLEATNQLNLSHTCIPIIKTALAQAVFNDAAKRGKATNYQAEIHDLIV